MKKKKKKSREKRSKILLLFDLEIVQPLPAPDR